MCANCTKLRLVFVLFGQNTKSKKLCKKVLTKEGESGRILGSPRGDNEILRKRALKKPRKKLEKSFKKVLTMKKNCAILSKLSRERERMDIEN